MKLALARMFNRWAWKLDPERGGGVGEERAKPPPTP